MTGSVLPPSARAERSVGVSSRGRYEHIDALRAFAVMLVVVAHSGLGNVVPGGSGVTLFFAISGFIITHILITERVKTGGFSVRRFYLRRVLKLAPPFLIVVAIPTIIVSFWQRIDFGAFAAQVFFVFNWVYMQGVPRILPGSGVVWSLAIEEQFYILFAVIWLFAARHRRYLTIITGLAVFAATAPLVLRYILAFGELNHRRSYYGTDTRIDGIAIGVLTALLLVQLRTGRAPAIVSAAARSSWVPFLAVGLYLASLVIRDPFFRETLRYTFQALAAAALILYGLHRTDGRLRGALGRVAGLRVVQLIGLSSYSIYLVHLILVHVLRPLTGGWPFALQFATNVVVGTGAGVLLWWVVERPVERFKSTLLPPLPARAPAPEVAASQPGS